jgi:hypothetical protein
MGIRRIAKHSIEKLEVLMSNLAVDLAPSGRWTLRDKAAQRRSPPRYAAHS